MFVQTSGSPEIVGRTKWFFSGSAITRLGPFRYCRKDMLLEAAFLSNISGMNSPSTTPKNLLRRTFRMYLFVGVPALLIGVFLLGVMGLLSLVSVNGFIILGLGVVVTISGLLGILLVLVFVAGRHQVDEVDGLLSGKTLIAHWSYQIDENNQPNAGYVYIGAKGIYKDGIYHYFVGRSRRLIAVTFEAGIPASLRFVYEVFSRPNSRSSAWSSQRNHLNVPIPPDKEAEARRVAEEFSRKIAGSENVPDSVTGLST